jgi:hypothetical protein
MNIHDDKSMLIIFAFLQTYRLGIHENSLLVISHENFRISINLYEYS